MKKQYETLHYIFHYDENSLAEKEIIKISAEQEACYEYIVSVLKKSPMSKICYFLYEDSSEIGRAYCERCEMEYEDEFKINGFSSFDKGEIYAVYNEQDKCIGFHEDAHFISFSDGKWSGSNAVVEGLAMYFDRVWWGIHNLHWTGYYLKNNQYIAIDKLIEDNDYFYSLGAELTYPIMGTFTEWLISTYGIEKYLEYYNEDDAVEACLKIYHKTLAEMNLTFMNYVLLFGIDEKVEQRMDELVRKKFEA